MRRGAAERGAVELKKTECEEEVQRQREQMSHMESLFKRQLEGSQNVCSQDKGKLQSNISSSAKTIQELKGQLNQINNDLGKLQKELQSCQGNIKTLNNKLTFDMTHCNSQVLSQKELCDERLAAAKLEFEKKLSKLASAQENSPGASTKEEALGTVKTVASTMTNHSESQVNEAAEILTNEITVGKDEEPSKEEAKPVPTAVAAEKDVLPPLGGVVTTEKDEPMDSKPMQENLTEDKDMELLDAHEEDAHSEKKDPGAEGEPMGNEKPDEDLVGLKTEDQDEYDVEEPVLDAGKPLNNKPENVGIDLEQELADYNGDDENEGEFEADKQAVLSQD